MAAAKCVDSCHEESESYEVVKSIADNLLGRIRVKPTIGIICGSGLGSLVDVITEQQGIDYKDIPRFPVSTVEGHAGRLVFGKIEGVPVVAMQGRFHYYEGYPIHKCAMPVRVLKLLGVEYLFVTNAAGGINPAYSVGDIMIIRDHVNFLGLAGHTPLRGANEPRFGPRFPPMNDAYNLELIARAKIVAKEMGLDNILREGVYACVGGPTYETIAELKLLHTCGVDAVGMSTAHEVVLAKHCGMKVFAFSLITNKGSLSYEKQEIANHEEVVAVGKNRQDTCRELLVRLIRSIAPAAGAADESCSCAA